MPIPALRLVSIALSWLDCNIFDYWLEIISYFWHSRAKEDFKWGQSKNEEFFGLVKVVKFISVSPKVTVCKYAKESLLQE